MIMTSMTVMPMAVTTTIATKIARVILFKMSQQKGKVLYKLGIDKNYMYSLTPCPIRASIDLITKFLGYEDRNQCMVCIMGIVFFPMGI